ncbi:hypothetical protein QR680_016514 [Steinernema hermaphroditum]|uniref:7TM GPCR serpentine receptor class x (Srx) domain-containing protein n=1 Tax=Steinernema hermaphroditum TaxID=289476 RepID=A0AA39HCK7_9BILA|nr:hypothetical protein QR680_016514 [Steinernema hermaphroditum]
MNNSSQFFYGTELQGTGEMSQENAAFGVAVLLLASLGLILGSTNLYYIRTVKIFHDAFGWLWASRTIGEMVNSVVHVLYTAPVTLLQPQQIKLWFGIAPYIILVVGSVSACLTHGFIAVNRNIAVYFPLKYASIFSKKNRCVIIAFTWCVGLFVAAFFFVFPCNFVGYSPQQLGYIFLKCFAGQERNFSYVGTIVNHLCLVICVFTLVIDLFSIVKVVYVQKKRKNDRLFKLNVRFFKQSAIENVIMLCNRAVVAHQNYRNIPGEVNIPLAILEAVTVLGAHIVNPLSFIVLNPEIRARISRKMVVEPIHSNPYRKY